MQFLDMERSDRFPLGFIFGCLRLIRNCLFKVLKVGPIPSHIAFIMDGNRTYAKKKNQTQSQGYKQGAWALSCVLLYCTELGVKYITVYAFSIDNFRRKPDEVGKVMDVIMENIEVLGKLAISTSMRVHLAGNLQFLDPKLRDAAVRLIDSTCHCSKIVLTICIAYTSTDDIMHAVQQSCQEQVENPRQEVELINMDDIEKHMYTAIVPDADVIIRTAGVHRLSNFLLWQSCCAYLSSLFPCWPEFGIWHLVWVILNYQRKYSYLVKKKNM